MTDFKWVVDDENPNGHLVPLTAEEEAQLAADQQVGATLGAQLAVSDGNRATLTQAALQALSANKNYLAITSPTNAQVVAQVKLLTRECSGVIRLLLDALDSTDGT